MSPEDRDDYPVEPEWDPAWESTLEEEDVMPQQQTNRGGKPPYRHKNNRGSMFDNERKTKETQPDFTGTIDVAGTIYWINGWKNTTQNGKRKIALSVQVQEERQPHQHDEGDEGNGWGGALPQRQQAPRKQNGGGW